jgi:prepilin-type processing-associated H-X9-DG protein
MANRSFPFHAQAGSVFSYVTGQERWSREQYDSQKYLHKTVYKVYMCPSSGKVGLARRVTYSINSLLDPSSWGISNLRLSRVQGSDHKAFFVDETAETNHNGSFYPGGSAEHGNYNVHSTGVNFSFVDGHIESIRHKEVMNMQNGDWNSNRPSPVRYYFHPFVLE